MQGVCSRHGAVAIAERYILRYHHKTGKVNRWYHRLVQPQSLAPVTHILHQYFTSYSFPNSSDNWRANIQTYTPNGIVLKPPHYLCAYMIAPICFKKPSLIVDSIPCLLHQEKFIPHGIDGLVLGVSEDHDSKFDFCYLWVVAVSHTLKS